VERDREREREREITHEREWKSGRWGGGREQKGKFSRMTGPEMPIGNRLKTQSTINVFCPTQMSVYPPLAY